MWRSLVPDACIALSVVLLWYFGSKIWLRRRTRETLSWIRQALEYHGEISAVYTDAPSRLRISVQLASGLFHSAVLIVRFSPCEMPLNWLWYVLRRRGETITFQADLENRPGFNLDVANQRWCNGKPKKTSQRSRVESENVGALVMTTRERWDISGMVDALLLSRSGNFLSLSFRRQSPHLQATVALETLRPGSASAINMFDVLRELATGASASA